MSERLDALSPDELTARFNEQARSESPAPAELGAYLKRAKELLDRGADPEADASPRGNALSLIIFYSRIELLDLLLRERPALIATPERRWALLQAACRVREGGKVAARLMELGADPNNTPAGSESALRCAVSYGAAETVEALIAAGAAVEAAADPARVSLASMAGQHQSLRILRALAAAGADLNAIGPHGTRPLHEACARWGKNGGVVAKALLELGADPNSLSDRGQTPLAYAMARTMPSAYGHKPKMDEAIAFLLENGADPSVPDANGQAPWDPEGWYGAHGSQPALRRYRERVEIDAVAAAGAKRSPRSL